MLEWLLITNDPYLVERWSMLETLLFFVAIGLILLHTTRYYLHHFHTEWGEKTAKSLGYADFNDLYSDTVRESIMWALLFIMGTATFYTFMHKEEVQQTFDCVAYSGAMKYCANKNMTLACVNAPKNPWESGGFPGGWNSSSVINPDQPG